MTQQVTAMRVKVRSNSNIQSAEIVEVIRTVVIEGKGTEEDPVRTMVQYWDLQGRLIGERLKNIDIGVCE